MLYSTVVDNRVAASITSQPSSMTVELGERVTLRCTAAGNPTPNIRWLKDGTLIEGPQAIGNEFVIVEATPRVRGFYMCEAFSSFGNPARSEEAQILIQGWIRERLSVLLIKLYTRLIIHVISSYCRYCPIPD